MMDSLDAAYNAYQNALQNLQDPNDPKLWYGIGILYERSDSLSYAQDAFTQVMQMDPKFEKANEIYFRLGIIYKQQQSITNLSSASSQSCITLHVLSPKLTFGSKLVTFMNNKRITPKLKELMNVF